MVRYILKDVKERGGIKVYIYRYIYKVILDRYRTSYKSRFKSNI